MNKSKLLLVISLLFMQMSLVYGLVQESGSFRQFLIGTEPACAYDNWLSHVVEGLASPGTNFYAPWDRQTPGFGAFLVPDDSLSARWERICTYFTLCQWANVDIALTFYHIPYNLIQFHDNDTGRTYYMLREQLAGYYDNNGTADLSDDESGSFNYGWGLVVMNPDSALPEIVTAPHPCDDFISVPVAWKAFTQLNARYLLIGGAGREVTWNHDYGYYSNNFSLSDFSRNPSHPLHDAYKMCCDEIRALPTVVGSTLPREFSLQVHSYDSNLHVGYANCQVSAGYNRFRPGLPIRDVSLTGTDLINSSPFLIHPVNTILDNHRVLASDFWAVYYNDDPFYYTQSDTTFQVSHHIDLPGYSQNNQMLYSDNGWTDYDVYDPFLHIEMDELPDCYPQTTAEMAQFYGWDEHSLTWNHVTRYNNAIAFYQPWIDALQNSLVPTLAMNDNSAPSTPVISLARLMSNSYMQITWQRCFEYDFQTWETKLTRMNYLGNGLFAEIDTLIYDRYNNSQMASQKTDTFNSVWLAPGYYRYSLAAMDKSGRRSTIADQSLMASYLYFPIVTDFHFDRDNSDATGIGLAWSALRDTILIDHYQILRRTAGSTIWEEIAILPQATSSFTDTAPDLDESTVYDYRLLCVGLGGLTFNTGNICSGFLRVYPASNTISISHPAPGTMQINWSPVIVAKCGRVDMPDFYRLLKSTSRDFSSPDTQFFSLSSTQFNDAITQDTRPDLHYFYRVTAVSGPSNR